MTDYRCDTALVAEVERPRGANAALEDLLDQLRDELDAEKAVSTKVFDDLHAAALRDGTDGGTWTVQKLWQQTLSGDFVPWSGEDMPVTHMRRVWTGRAQPFSDLAAGDE